MRLPKKYVKEHFDKVIDTYGYQAAYIRRDRDIRCSCYDERTREANISCDKCFQTGYKVSIEYVKTRRRIVTVVETNVALRLNYEGGVQSPKAFVYYFKKEVAPKEGDLIIEFKETESGKRIITDKYLISVAEHMRDLNGEIAFYQTYSKFEEKGDFDDKTIQRD